MNNPRNTRSLKQYGPLLKIVAVLVVLGFIGGGIIWLQEQTGSSDITLEGVGCDRSESGLCEVVSGEDRVVLRDCDDENTICDQSWYELGKQVNGTQYVLLRSEGIQMLTLIGVNPEDLTVTEGERYFFTDVAEGCEEGNDTYEEECFSYAVSEEQRQDVWAANQAYQEAEQKYKK